MKIKNDMRSDRYFITKQKTFLFYRFFQNKIIHLIFMRHKISNISNKKTILITC